MDQSQNSTLKQATELTLDFDNTVGTEDRFAIRHFLENFVDIVNYQSQEQLTNFISEAATAQGFSEFMMQKPEILDLFYKKFFGRRHSYIVFSNLKLTMSKQLYLIKGSYEEYTDGILSAAGSIDLYIVKNDERYQITNFIFYPRMRLV